MTDETLTADEVVVPATTDEQLKPEELGDSQEPKVDEAHADDDAAHRNKVPAVKRIKQLTRKFRESERENLELRNRLDSLEKRIGPPPAPARPARDDYNSDQEYEDALFDWRDSVKSPKPEKKADSGLTPEIQQVVNEFEDELEQLTDKFNDDEAYDLVMNGDWNCTKDMFDYILASEVRAEMAYHLAKHPEISKKISGLSPILAARELAKVEAEVASNVKNDVSTQTNVPPPPLSTTKPASVAITNAEKMSTAQWVEQRRKQMAEKRR